MRRSAKVKQSKKSVQEMGQRPKSQREAKLLRENLIRRKLQIRARTRLEGKQDGIDVVDD